MPSKTLEAGFYRDAPERTPAYSLRERGACSDDGDRAFFRLPPWVVVLLLTSASFLLGMAVERAVRSEGFI